MCGVVRPSEIGSSTKDTAMHRRTFLTASLAPAPASLLGAPALAASRWGRFEGRTGHIASGRGVLTDMGVSLQADFRFDGAPEPRMGLGRGGAVDPATDMGALRRNAGAQLYGLPRTLSAADYDEIYVWCRKFNVPLAVARIA